MLKLFISIILIASSTLPLSGCSSLDEFSLVYQPDTQQGNIVDQEMVDQLKTGMSKRQVRFIMGTPLLIDVFHQERWDYYFSMKKSRTPIEKQLVSIYFVSGRLAAVKGDLQPDNSASTIDKKRETVVSVPDYIDDRGLITRALYRLGLLDDE